MPESVTLTLSPLLERALLYAAVAVSTYVAFTNWRRGDARAFRKPLLAFFGLWFVEGGLFAAASAPNLIPAPLVRGLDFAAIVLLAWGFLASALPARLNGALLGGGMTLAAALSAFSLSAARITGGEPAWIDAVWSITSLIVSTATALTLALRRSPDRTSGAIAAFAGLALSAMLAVLLLPDLAGISRLIAFWLFPVGLYQRALSDLRAARETLREFSQSALKQTQELVTLLEASAYLSISLDVDELLRNVIERVAAGIEYERAMIVLSDPGAPETFRIACSYPRGPIESGSTLALSAQPALALATSSGEQVSLGPRGQGAAALARLMNVDRLGPAIIQPLSTPDKTVGAFVVANPHNRREFDERQKRLLGALGAQLTAAIVNAQLYRGLDQQARELAHVLALRDEEIVRHTATLESISDGVVITDRFDQVITTNAAALRILDIPRDQLLGRPLGAIFERLTPLAGAPKLDPPSGSLGAEVVRAAFQRADRVIHVSITPAQSLLGDRLGLVVMFRDITAERQAEQGRIQFIGSIAQEFRAPLATMKGYADLLAKGAAGALPSAAHGFVETIRANAERLGARVNAIFQFHELDRGRIELIVEEADIASILAETADEHRPHLEARGLSLDLNVKPNLPTVRADRARVRQILDQLIDNARKFTPDGGRIRLSAAPSWDGQSADRPAYVAVSVEDTGAGFDRHDGERLFERYYRAETPAQIDQAGLGIGLSIARGLCEAMGGQLWARGEKGRGSTFTFILPVARVTHSRLAGAPSEGTSIESWIEQAFSFLEDDDNRTTPIR